MFNLGFMHQMGIGVPVDLHLAKRYYDMAVETAPEARLPATIALTAMNALAYITELLGEPPTSSHYSVLLGAVSARIAEYAPANIGWDDVTWENAEKLTEVCIQVNYC
jgi:hypothetical protein